MSYRSCVVCKSTTRDSTLSFHRFPSDETLRRIWIQVCGLNNKEVKRYTVICSKHFQELDFNTLLFTTRRLQKGVVPSLDLSSTNTANQGFQEKKHLVDISNVAGPSNTNKPFLIGESTPALGFVNSTNPESTDANVVKQTEATPPRIPRYIGDLTIQHFSTPTAIEENVEFVKNVLREYRHKVQLLTKEKQKLERYVSCMKDLLEILKTNEPLSEEAATAILKFTNS